jgi:2-polyprenyl-3-methyl-5-hydroxy-6-metoxy-1,4-benzoquinol methylase|nr:MAG: methyltransferase domain protein [Candidatus Nanosalinarum sp. J07AB56]
MTKEAAKFYSRGAQEFAENHSIQRTADAYLELLDRFADKLGNQAKVLDAGCGPGADVKYMDQKGLNPVGIDLSSEMIQEARERVDADFRVMDVSDMDFEDESFEGVWCNTVLIFFEPAKMEEVIGELSRVLKTGGTLYVGLKRGEGSFRREKYGSEITQHLISKEEATKMLEEKGVAVENVVVNETDQEFDFLNIFARKRSHD